MELKSVYLSFKWLVNIKVAGAIWGGLFKAGYQELINLVQLSQNIACPVKGNLVFYAQYTWVKDGILSTGWLELISAALDLVLTKLTKFLPINHSNIINLSISPHIKILQLPILTYF